MTLQKLLLMISASYSLTACGGKLKPDICISAPSEQKLHCYDYRTQTPHDRSWLEVDGWACLSPVDFQNVLNACKRAINGPQVNSCIISYSTLDLSCYNQASHTVNRVLFADSENYVCISPLDDKTMLDYCKTTITQHVISTKQ